MAERKNSEARIRANNKYAAKAYDRINIAVPKGRKDEIKALADTRGQSVNAYIISAVDEKMERDGGAAAPGAAPVERVLAETATGRPQEAAGAPTGAGGISLPPDALESAQQAAERTGEAPAVFVARAIKAQAKRDGNSIKLGINPVTGDKLNQTDKGGAQ